MPPFYRISEDFNEAFHIGELLEVAEQLQDEYAHRVIREADQFVLLGHDGANKRDVYQGGDESGKPSNDPAVGVDFDASALVSVFGKPEGFGFGPLARRADGSERKGRLYSELIRILMRLSFLIMLPMEKAARFLKTLPSMD